MKKFCCAVATTVAAALVLAAGAFAARGTQVAFTVDQPFGGVGTILVSSVPGCATGTVATPDYGGKLVGPMGLFWGTKVFDCGSSGTFSLDYRAHTFVGAPTDEGTWKVVDGTGMYTGMTGQGLIGGTYYHDFTGIYDSYTGTIRLG